MAIPKRLSFSPLAQSSKLAKKQQPVLTSERLGGFHIDPTTHYTKSQARQKRVPIEYLAAFGNALPIYGAITRISNGIAGMPWSILPPEGDLDSQEEDTMTKGIESALREPNVEETDSYSLFTTSVIRDLLKFNVAAVERLPGLQGDRDHPFWLWSISPDRIQFNKEWTPQTDGFIPRYYDTQGNSNPLDWRPLLSKELFLIKYYASSKELVPPGPLEICYNCVVSWLGLVDYQFTTTSRASQEYILDIGQCTPNELKEFRAYFQETTGTLIIGRTAGSHPIEVKKLGARTDEELYLKYEEKLLRFLALGFQLSPRDMNITADDSYATADVSASSTFQFAVLPMAKCWFERINKDVVNFFVPGYKVEPSDMEPRNEKDEAETAGTLKKDGIITLNEARLRTGYKEIGQKGDVFVDGSRSDDLPVEPKPADLAPTIEISGDDPPDDPGEKKSANTIAKIRRTQKKKVLKKD